MEDLDIGISGMRKLIQSVRDVHDVDLGVYATTFFKRRVAQIMLHSAINNIEDFTVKLASPDYFAQFQKQLTVDSTEFFRDPAFWRYFKNELCPLFARNKTQIKIWVPGCNSGEEVLSAAITLIEAGIYDKCVIIATDINEKIIKNSHLGAYPNSKLELSENNYKRYKGDENANFLKYITPHPHGFIINRALFQNIHYDVFSYNSKNRIGGVSLILCRNIFIYFTSGYQEKMLEIFTESLNINGFFAIGNKENISFCNDVSKYLLVNEKENVYRKISD